MIIRFCPYCGNKLIEGASFCPSCGQKVEAPSNPRPAASPVNDPQELMKRFGFKNAQSKNESPSPDVTEVHQESQSPAQEEIIPEPARSEPEAVPPENENPDKVMEKRQAELNGALSEINEPESAPIRERPPTRPKKPSNKPKKKPQKKPTPIVDRFLAGRYADEIEAESAKTEYIQDDLYNRSIVNDYNNEVDQELDEISRREERERMKSKGSRAMNSVQGRAKKAASVVVNKAAEKAAKRLITDDRTLSSRKKVYIIEQDEMADPDDPTYKGYYENIIPIDEAMKANANHTGKEKFALNDETKKTIWILVGLIVALIVIVFTQF